MVYVLTNDSLETVCCSMPVSVSHQEEVHLVYSLRDKSYCTIKYRNGQWQPINNNISVRDRRKMLDIRFSKAKEYTSALFETIDIRDLHLAEILLLESKHFCEKIYES